MEPSQKMSKEERRRLDRQRFIGLQTQRKLLASRILITPLNGPNTQLAKNLVLAGVNVTVYDNHIVTEDDFETNFLVAADEIGKKRGQVVFDKLKDMNPSGKNQLFLEEISLDNIENLSRFTILCTSLLDFEKVKKWDEISKILNKPYYNLVTAGLYGFSYISLGKEYTFKQPTKEKTIKCLTFEECMDKASILKLTRKDCDFLVAILMIYESQKKSLTYDPFDESNFNSEMLKCMVEIGADIKEEIDEDFLKNFARLYGVDYCPTYSVIGSIISQQIIKVVENQKEPGSDWLIFNSEEGFSKIAAFPKSKSAMEKQEIIDL